MQLELRQIQKEVGITAIFVTHDHEEALTMSDRVAVMRNGRIAQLGTPTAVYRSPADGFVAESLGEANFLQGVVQSDAENGFVLDLGDGRPLKVSTKRPLLVGERYTLAIRPEDIDLVPAGSTGTGPVGLVRSIAFAGNTTLVVVEALGREFLVRRPNTTGAKNGFTVGEEVTLAWIPDVALVLPEDKGANI